MERKTLYSAEDKVVIKKDLREGQYLSMRKINNNLRYAERVFVTSEMALMAGKTLNVEKIEGDGVTYQLFYRLKGQNYRWTDEMFESKNSFIFNSLI